MKKSNKLIIVVLVVALCIGYLLLARYRTSRENMLAMKEMPQKLEQKILAFDLSNYAADGSKKWQLKGDSADIFADIVSLNNIDMVTYEDPKITLTALKGNYDKDNKEISLFEDVRMLTSDGAKLTTDYLKWNGNTDTITTDKPVRIERSDVIAEGNGAKAFPQMKRVILNEDVSVKLATNVIKSIEFEVGNEQAGQEADEKPNKAEITCKGPLEIDYEKNIAIFENDVLVDDRKGRIYSDKMEAFLHPVTKNIIKVVAEGNVKVVRGEDSTYSQKAIYTTEDQKIILVGKPQIFIRSSTKELDDMEKELEGL